MDIFLIILFIAASPLIFIFIFSEVMAAKEGSQVHDVTLKFSKTLAWLIFVVISLSILFICITDGPAYHLRQVFKFISAILGFL